MAPASSLRLPRLKEFHLYILTFSALFVLLYHQTVRELVTVWAREEDYGHGFLIFPISLYLVWQKRRRLFDKPVRPDSLGLFLLSLWALLYLVGVGAEISTFENSSVVVFLLGVLLFIAGRDIAKMLLFPVLFLTFMFPIPSEMYTSLTNPLVLLTTTGSVHILQLFEVPVLQEGNLINLPNSSMEVILACSGIRSLISIVALALLMGYALLSSHAQRFVLLLFSLPVSLLGNIFRITATGFCTYYFPSRISPGFLHTAAGLSILAVSFVCLLSLCLIILWIERKRMQYLSWFLR